MEDDVLLWKLDSLQKENERLRIYAEMLSSLIANDVDCDVLPRCNSSGNGDTPPVKFDVKEENAKLLYKEVYQYLYENGGSEIANAVRNGLKGRFETLLGIKL